MTEWLCVNASVWPLVVTCRQMFDEMDSDGSKALEWDEFLTLMKRLRQRPEVRPPPEIKSQKSNRDHKHSLKLSIVSSCCDHQALITRRMILGSDPVAACHLMSPGDGHVDVPHARALSSQLHNGRNGHNGHRPVSVITACHPVSPGDGHVDVPDARAVERARLARHAGPRHVTPHPQLRTATGRRFPPVPHLGKRDCHRHHHHHHHHNHHHHHHHHHQHHSFRSNPYRGFTPETKPGLSSASRPKMITWCFLCRVASLDLTALWCFACCVAVACPHRRRASR
jgi:hypothetical protein